MPIGIGDCRARISQASRLYCPPRPHHEDVRRLRTHHPCAADEEIHEQDGQRDGHPQPNAERNSEVGVVIVEQA